MTIVLLPGFAIFRGYCHIKRTCKHTHTHIHTHTHTHAHAHTHTHTHTHIHVYTNTYRHLSISYTYMHNICASYTIHANSSHDECCVVTCSISISGNAPPSPKSVTVRGLKPCRLPYGGGWKAGFSVFSGNGSSSCVAIVVYSCFGRGRRPISTP